MEASQEYVRSKFSVAVGFLAGPESLCRRVVKAWTEIAVVEPESLKDSSVRTDFEWILSKQQFAVIEGLDPKATEAECEEVRQRIMKIEAQLGRD
jgi:hypothetical protein